MRGSSLAPRAPKHLGLKATLGAFIGYGTAYASGCDEPTCLVSTGLAAVTVRIALIDLKLRIIQDRDALALLAIGLIWNVWISLDVLPDIEFTLMKVISCAGAFQTIRFLYLRTRGRVGLGFGDVKLAGAASPLLFTENFALAVAAAAISGIIFIKFRNIAHNRTSSRYIYAPFGCLLSLTTYFFWLARILQ